MSSGDVSVTIEGGIARLVLSNPDRRNAISSAMWRALSGFAADATRRTDVRVALIRGEGTLAFSGGADISDFSAARSDASGAQSYDELVESACAAIEGLSFPVVALVRGACVGAGAALAASCDIRIASEDAFFAIPAARLGLGYDPRGVARLVRAYGAHTTRHLFFTAERLSARRVYELGGIDHMAGLEEVDGLGDKIVARIAENAPLTLKAAKLSIRAAEGVGGGILTEARHLTQLANASLDYREGRLAFSEKRAPRFSGT